MFHKHLIFINENKNLVVFLHQSEILARTSDNLVRTVSTFEYFNFFFCASSSLSCITIFKDKLMIEKDSKLNKNE